MTSEEAIAPWLNLDLRTRECCGGSDETEPEHTQDCVALTAAQALADMRTLDAVRQPDHMGYCERVTLPDQRYDPPHTKFFYGPTPEAARAKAAAWVREQDSRGQPAGKSGKKDFP